MSILCFHTLEFREDFHLWTFSLCVPCLSLLVGLITLANSNPLFTFLTLHITAPDVLAFTAFLDFLLKCLMPAAATHVCTTTLPSSVGITLPTRSTQCPAGRAPFAVVRRWVQGNKVPWSVSFSSPWPEHLLITALAMADHVNDVVVLLLEECGHLSELTQASETRFGLAWTGYPVASANNRHFVSNSLKLKIK